MYLLIKQSGRDSTLTLFVIGMIKAGLDNDIALAISTKNVYWNDAHRVASSLVIA